MLFPEALYLDCLPHPPTPFITYPRQVQPPLVSPGIPSLVSQPPAQLRSQPTTHKTNRRRDAMHRCKIRHHGALWGKCADLFLAPISCYLCWAYWCWDDKARLPIFGCNRQALFAQPIHAPFTKGSNNRIIERQNKTARSLTIMLKDLKGFWFYCTALLLNAVIVPKWFVQQNLKNWNLSTRNNIECK